MTATQPASDQEHCRHIGEKFTTDGEEIPENLSPEQTRQMLQELKRNNDYFKAVLMAANDGIILQERSGNIIIWNHTAERVFGISASQACSLTPASYNWRTYREDGTLFPGSEHPSMHTLATGESCFNTTMKVVRDTGDYSWININTSPIFKDEESRPIAVVITFSDITERKQAEDALRESELCFRAYFDLGLIGMATSSVDKQWLQFNDQLCSILGYPREELANIKWPQNTHPDDLAVDEARFESVLRGEIDGYSLDKRFVKKDGSIVYCDISIKCVRNQDGSPNQFVVMVRDITERKQAEKVLQSRIRINEYALTHSLNELLIKVTDEAEDLTGSRIGFFHCVNADQVSLSLQAWSTNTLLTTCTSEDASQHYPLDSAGVWADCIREKRALIHNNYESLPNRKGLPPGHVPVQRELVVPIFRKHQIVGVLGVGNKKTDYTVQEMTTIQHLANLAWDIVTRKQAEETVKAKQQQLEALNLSLENRISTALTEMRQKDDMLIQQGRLAAMGEMINNIAHQWRQPLNNLGLIVQNLQLSYEAGQLTLEEMDRDVSKAMGVILYMSRTIDDFRNFFRYEKEPSVFIVNQVISSALNFVSPALASSGIDVKLDEQPDIRAKGYPNEYLQVILNILNNAKDALQQSRPDNPLISIRICSKNSHSAVIIQDNGGGIPKSILPKIFDPYFSTKGHGQGTGLGLYMSKMIIEKNMGGHLTARNVNGGSEFRIEV